ncbi:MAG: 2-dehydropantoate 2-reductase [Desulfobulbaceae bacterium]|nr:2-dehydropantoate 2-reductase [Desulfobulbaceae bacterium]
MKIAVIGPGAMGCLLAGALCDANKVWLLDHNPDRADLLNRQGLVIEEIGHSRSCRVNVTADLRQIGPVELILLCVKAGKVKEVLHAIGPLCNQESLLLALQNGIGHLPLLPEILGDSACWGLGVTSHGATLIGPGYVLHKGQGITRIGLPTESISTDAKSIEKLTAAAQTLTGAGIQTELVPDILNHVWAKLLVNVGINALTAIHDCPNGVLLESVETVAIMEAAVLEAKHVAEKIGITFGDDPWHVTRQVCLATAANISSMLQDIRARRPTEIEAINGALIRKAAELGLPTPVNEELVRKVKEIERNIHDFT